MIRIAAIVTGTSSQALSRLRSKRRTEGAVAMTEDEHQEMLEMERETAELAHAKWAANRMVAYLRQVVESGGQFIRGGNGFIHTAVVPQDRNTLDTAVELAASPTWVEAQLNTLRVKPRHRDAARAHLATLMVAMIETEVGEGY